MKTYFILAFVAIAMSANLPAQETSLELPKGGILSGKETGEPEPENPKKKKPSNNEIYIAAQRFLNGINTEVNYQRALKGFAYLTKQGDPKAMNALAGMLRQGMGIPKNEAKARALYRKASELGYGKASYNLAMMYKTAQGGKQDFKKAFMYAFKAKKQGYQPAVYLLGYLHFKGLGTEQDYGKAVQYFSQGAKLKQSSSCYFLGQCYLSGYGVERDFAKSRQLIEEAAKLGNDHAVDFIVNEKYKQYEKSGNIDPQGKPYPTYRKVKNDAGMNLNGEWTGRILQYDWGKKNVTEERSLKLQISNKNGVLSGSWLQSDSVSMTLSATRDESPDNYRDYRLENMQYLQLWDRTWELERLRFAKEIDARGDTVLYANLIQFSPQTVEPSAPLMLELRRAPAIVETGHDPSLPDTPTLTVYPNPFADELNVQITTAKAQTATLSLYDLSGRRIKTETLRLSAGEQVKTIQTAHLPIGTYAVSVKGKGLNLNTLVIKK